MRRKRVGKRVRKRVGKGEKEGGSDQTTDRTYCDKESGLQERSGKEGRGEVVRPIEESA